ncbi:MAG: HIT family hydrolase [candidate division Zixibacteria bacterium 4484_93]|nr:MAG: HIT family hydrolase [candidate division Zixibacteria bacterium 4484_93]
MEVIFAPWRMEYITRGDLEEGCLFCRVLSEENDRENLLLFRGGLVSVVMNRYPYANGHLMVFPNRHTGNIEEMTSKEASDLFRFVSHCVKILKKVVSPSGFNIGMNIGRSAGAGVVDHLHIHIVPRWDGDTNFMPVVSSTKIISEALEATYDKLLPQFKRL